MRLDYRRLFEPYTGDGHTLENSIAWINKECAKRNIHADIGKQAIKEIFIEMKNGREFPKNKCPCGCGIDKAATALIHEIMFRAIQIHTDTLMKPKEVDEIGQVNIAALAAREWNSDMKHVNIRGVFKRILDKVFPEV